VAPAAKRLAGIKTAAGIRDQRIPIAVGPDLEKGPAGLDGGGSVDALLGPAEMAMALRQVMAGGVLLKKYHSLGRQPQE